MARVVIAPLADADNAEIIGFLSVVGGKRTAAKFNELFKKLYLRLSDHPRSGVQRPTLGKNVRIGIVAPYIIIYRHDDSDNVVNVLRIVHGRRHITGQMLTSK